MKLTLINEARSHRMDGKLKPKYSGSLSQKFWDRVGKIKPARLNDAIYMAGCALQNHERLVLQMLIDAEQSKRTE